MRFLSGRLRSLVKEEQRSCYAAGVRRSSERGSALLIVFVFAAIVAITLYRELPVAAFEAQRQKEQTLVDAGTEYAHAVKLFVRKTGRYPNSIKDLEDTNRMRFLRRELPDPFTGKADWRLLHSGPGGTLIDSKVNPISPTGNTSPSNNGKSNAPNASGLSTSSFGSSGGGNTTGNSFGTNPATASNVNSNADVSGSDVVVQQPRQRAPAIAANGSQPPGNTAESNVDTASPPLPPDPQPNGTAANTSTTAGPAANPAAPAANPTTGGAQPANANAAAPDLKSSMLAAAGPGAAQTNSFGSTNGTANSNFGTNTMNSGSLAGVASKARGHSIKAVNDQTNYSLWEFYYDPKKDTVPGGIQMGASPQQTGVPGQQQTGPNGQNSSSGSPSFGQSSSFGQNNSSGSSFGQNNSSGFGQNSGSSQSSFGSNSNNTNSTFGQNNSSSSTNPNSTTTNQQNPQ